MNEDKLDALLKRMPEIATAVNSFQSEAIQHEAFLALIDAYFGVAQRPTGTSTPDEITPNAEASEEIQPSAPSEIPPVKTRTRKQGKRPSGSKDSFKFIRELDLRPNGKKSFADFVAEKQPGSNEDKYAVTVYWLKEIAGLSTVSGDHVGSAFRLTQGWREPSDVKAALRVVAARKGIIDTSSPDDLKLTPHGRNFVEHDLPPVKKAKN